MKWIKLVIYWGIKWQPPQSETVKVAQNSDKGSEASKSLNGLSDKQTIICNVQGWRDERKDRAWKLLRGKKKFLRGSWEHINWKGDNNENRCGDEKLRSDKVTHNNRIQWRSAQEQTPGNIGKRENGRELTTKLLYAFRKDRFWGTIASSETKQNEFYGDGTSEEPFIQNKNLSTIP